MLQNESLNTSANGDASKRALLSAEFYVMSRRPHHMTLATVMVVVAVAVCVLVSWRGRRREYVTPVQHQQTVTLETPEYMTEEMIRERASRILCFCFFMETRMSVCALFKWEFCSKARQEMCYKCC